MLIIIVLPMQLVKVKYNFTEIYWFNWRKWNIINIYQAQRWNCKFTSSSNLNEKKCKIAIFKKDFEIIYKNGKKQL